MMCDDLDILNRELDRLLHSNIAEGKHLKNESEQPPASDSWDLSIISGSEVQCQIVQELIPSGTLTSEATGWFPEKACMSQPFKSTNTVGLMLNDLDPLLPSSSNLFHLDLPGDANLKTNSVQVTVADDKGDQNNDDSLKTIRPTSKDFKKTWGFRRTTIAKREGAGDAEMEATAHIQQQQMQKVHQQLQQLKEQQSTSNQSLRRSGRQPKRTERVEEFMTAVRRNRVRRSAPAALEDTSETSCPVTDVETASEGSVESVAEIKSECLRNDADDTEEPMSIAATDLKGDDDSSSDSDALTLKELQNRLRKRQTETVTVETVVAQGERPIKEEPMFFELEPPKDKIESPNVDIALPVKVELPTIKVEPPDTPERKLRCPVSVTQEPTLSIWVKKEDVDSLKPINQDHQEAQNPGPELTSSDESVLHCICRQPHNKRFMICCDRCEKWFHGDCVGISEARWQLLEKNEEDYVCPNCVLLKVKEECSSDGTLSITKPEYPGFAGTALSTSGTAEEKSDDQAIKGRIEKAVNPSRKKKCMIFNPVIEAPVVPKCIGPGCSNLAQPDSVYCSHDCILKHAAATMKSLRTGKESKPKEKALTKPEKVTPPKLPPPATTTSQSGQKRPAPEKRVIKMKKMLVMVSKMDIIPTRVLSEPVGETGAPSWESDHNYNAVKLEKAAAALPPAASPAAPAAITSSVFNKSGKEEDAKPVEPVPPTQNMASPTAPTSMKKRIAALPRIPMLKRPLPSDPQQSQPTVRLSPLNSNNHSTHSPLTAASLAPSRVSPAPSSVDATPASKKIMLSSSSADVKKTDCSSPSPSPARAVKKAENSSGSAGVGKKSEGLSAPPVSVGVAKKAEGPVAPRGPVGAGKMAESPSAPGLAVTSKRVEGPSTSSSSAKPAANPSHPQPNLQMRLNIRRSLKEILWKRVGDSDDLMMAENEVAKVAMNIEKEMFGLFRETDSRYKSKYRNLMLNLKDPKNQGLFHRVLREEISLSKLVRLKPEELISKRLSSWKSRTAKPTSDSKSKSHMEHKGSDSTQTIPNMEDSPPVSDSDDPEQPLEPAKPAASEKSRPVLPDIFSSMLNDTTNQHRAHLFDLNCKICTGQISVSEDDVAPRRSKTSFAPAKKTELKHKSDFRMKTESMATGQPTVEGLGTADTISTSSSDPSHEHTVEKGSTTQGATSDESSLPMQSSFYPDTSAARVVTTVTVSGRDPRTALNRLPPTVTPAPDPSASPARDKVAVEETKPEMPKPLSTTFPVPKSILMKPSSLDPRYLPSSSLNLNIGGSRSPQDGDTSLFLSRLGALWKGFINMQNVAKFVTKAYPVSGSFDYLDEDLPDTVHIGGRISPKTVWDYVGKLKSSVSKELCLIRFQPATEEEEVAYISLYSYFSSRGRFGVVANNNRHIKDLYLIPLSAKDPIPSKLLPFDGPGLESTRPNLLLGLVICQKGKRPATILETDKLEEKRTKVQIPEEADIIHSKFLSSQQEKKILKYQPFSKEPTIIPSPPRSPKSPPVPEPVAAIAPKLFSSLPSVKTETTVTVTATVINATATIAPSVQNLSTPVEVSAITSTTSTSVKSATPLEHILKTLFGKKKPFDLEPGSSVVVTEQVTPDQRIKPPMVDPIVQQYGHTSKEKLLEEVGDDRPYDPEEEYDPGKAFTMDKIIGTENLYKPDQPCETEQEDDEAYDPEDETIFEEAKVVVDDFPNKIPSEVIHSNVELPGEYLSAITAASSLVEQQKMLEELNKQIEEQKRQLEAQEEALRQQRAAVGVSMAHFSVSDALMSPPPKSSLTKTELFQQEEQSSITIDEELNADKLTHLNTQKSDSKHTLDFWQAASRLVREANENANYQLPKERKTESPEKEKPVVSNESKAEVLPLNECSQQLSATTQPLKIDDFKLVSSEEAYSLKNIEEKDNGKQEISAPPLKVNLQPADHEEMPVTKPESQTVLSTPGDPSFQPNYSATFPKDQSCLAPPNLPMLKESREITLPQTARAQFSNIETLPLEKPSESFESEKRLSAAHPEDPRNPVTSQCLEPTNNQFIQADGKRDSQSMHFQENIYPFMSQNVGPPPHLPGLSNPPLPRFGFPYPNFPGYRGPATQSFSESNASNNEQHRPSFNVHDEQKVTVPPFSGPYGQSSHFTNRGPPVSHHSDEKGTSPSQLEDHSGSHMNFPETCFEQKSTASSMFDGPRPPQFMGNIRPPSFPFDGQCRLPPPHFTPHSGSHMQHQFVGMRGAAPFSGTRAPNPNEFAEPTGPVSSNTSGPRGLPSNEFDEKRNLQPSYSDQRGESQHMFTGPKGPRVSRFSDSHEPIPSRFNYREQSSQNTPPSRFNYQEQSPQSVKPSSRPLLELPNYSPQQHNEGWEHGSPVGVEGIDPEGQRSPNEFRERKEYDQRAQSFEARQREGGNIKDKVDQPYHLSDGRRGRGHDERRGGRGTRGSWRRGNSRNWNREREGERFREDERHREGDRHRDGERNRDWDRHRDREPNREWDKSRERDQHKDRDLEKNKELERNRDRSRYRDRERDSNKRRERERSRSKDRDRNRDTEREDRDRFREHDRDRVRDRDRDRDRTRDRERERDRDRERGSDRERVRGKDHKDRSTSKESSKNFKPEGQKESQRPSETQASPSIKQT
ncbi:death-inducer obliterator 1 isoform X2 [Lissotriton helveticus]